MPISVLRGGVFLYVLMKWGWWSVCGVAVTNNRTCDLALTFLKMETWINTPF